MKIKIFQLTLSILYICNYAQAATKAILDDISDVIDSCDYTRFDNQLENLKKGNSILEYKIENIEKFLDSQKNILIDLERKLNNLPRQIEEAQEKLIKNNRLNSEDLKYFLSKEIKTLNPVSYPVDDKIILINDMKEMLEKHDGILNNIMRNQNDSQVILKNLNLDKHTQTIEKTISDKLAIVPQMEAKLSLIEKSMIPSKLYTNVIENQNNIKNFLKEMNLEKHTQTIKNVISDRLAIVPQMATKLSNIENNIISRNILSDVINNQNNIKSLLKEINLEKHTQTIKNTISENLAIVPKMDTKLTNLEGNTVPKTEQLKFYHEVLKYLNNRDSTKLCLIDNNQNLICTSQSYPTSCANLDPTHCTDNKCLIINRVYGPKPFFVSCNNSVDGGGWIVIQRRINGSVDFYRNWSEYKAGFGDINGEFFIGLDKLHALTSTIRPVELMIQLEDFNNTIKYAKYDDFEVGNETEYYKLINVGSYTGDAGNSFIYHVGYNFTTKDRDNDIASTNCAVDKTGAWWYEKCGWSNLNGKYYHDPSELYDAPLDKRGINWELFHGYQYSLKYVQMMIRPKGL